MRELVSIPNSFLDKNEWLFFIGTLVCLFFLVAQRKKEKLQWNDFGPTLFVFYLIAAPVWGWKITPWLMAKASYSAQGFDFYLVSAVVAWIFFAAAYFASFIMVGIVNYICRQRSKDLGLEEEVFDNSPKIPIIEVEGTGGKNVITLN